MQGGSKKVTGEKVRLDGGSFDGISFRGCTFLFGGAPFSLINCDMSDCKWVFDGQAASTLQVLTMLYHNAGGRELVEKTFDSIRLGAFPKDGPAALGHN